MRGLVRVCLARNLITVTVVTAIVLIGVFVWHDQGIVIDYFPPQQPIGLAPDELGAFLLAAILPAITVNPLGLQERKASFKPRMALTAYTICIGLLPALTAPVWAAAIVLSQPSDQIPSVPARAASFALLGLCGLLLTLLGGPTLGPILSIVLFSGFAVAQNAFGPELGGNLLSTGDHWHTNLWADAFTLIAAVGVAAGTTGTPRRGLG